MVAKAKCFIQVSGEISGPHGKKIPVMRDWIAFLPNPVEPLSISIEASKQCSREGISDGEVVHYQKIGVVEQDD